MKRENFELESIKATREGVTAKYKETIPVKDGVKYMNHNPETDIEPTSDLLDLFDQLIDPVRKAYGLDKKAKVTVHKVAVSGKDQLKGCVITGKLESWNGSKLALNTPRITFSSEKIGLEAAVMGIVEKIEDEAFNYFVNHKYANPTLFDVKEDAA